MASKGPGFDFLAEPEGRHGASPTKYMKKAGYASGKYDGSDELLMVTANVDPGKAQAEVAKAQLEKLGFKIRLRTVPQDAVYTEWCQLPAKKVADLRRARVVQGLQRPAVDARADVQGLDHLQGRRQQQPRPSSTTRRSTRPWTRPPCSRATSASRPGARSTR